MVKGNKKYGFSLAEALVSMLVLALFFTATSKIMTGKQVQDVSKDPHGYMECYYGEDGQLYLHKATNDGAGGDPQPAADRGCLMQPSAGARYYIILNISQDGTYSSMVEPIFNTPVIIKPGSGRNTGILPLSDAATENYFQINADTEQTGSKENLYAYLLATNPNSILRRYMATHMGDGVLPLPGDAVFVSW